MADFKKYFPTLVKWEGSSFEIVPGDAGGPTNIINSLDLNSYLKLDIFDIGNTG